MPRFSELQDTDFPSLGFIIAAANGGESYQMTLSQIKSILGLAATDIAYLEHTVADAINNLASDKANIAEVATALDGKQNIADILTALSPLVPAADRLPYLTGANSAALTVLSSFARTLLDDANAAAVYATLGQVPNAQIRNDLTVDKAYRGGNVLGSPGFVGIVPSQALSTGWIQSAAGYHRRWFDGALECLAPLNDPLPLTFSNAAVLNRLWTFPYAFIDSGPLFVGITGASSAPAGGHRESTFFVNGRSATSINIGMIDNASTYTSGDTYNVQVYACGRWANVP